MGDLEAVIEETSRFYRATDVPAYRRLEQVVLGSDWGGNGYTTLHQAKRLVDLVALEPGRRLLDVGAGRGWPGLFMAAVSGCDVVLVDLPENALHAAVRRARTEQLDDRVAAVVGSAAAMPFAPASFDAIVHADVLC